jgi:two-component system OmpR family sensor kinase
MARIESEARRMGVLVEDLLALASLDQAPEHRQMIVNVRELAEHAAEDARILAPDRDIVLEAPEPVAVLGDPDQLRRLLSNLSRNAIIHTPAATPIELTLSRADGLVVLTVRDHGAGLPPDSTEQLFERFWRAEGGRSRGRAGAGLGLAIGRAIARAHGGDIRGANASGGGAVFTVTLPAAPQTSSQEDLSVLTADSYPQHPD